MKAFYDICFTTNEQYQFLHVQYGDIYIENTYAPLFKNWISYQRHITSVFPIAEEDTSGEFVWDGDSFSYERMDAPNQGVDEITGGKGITFATGTPISNSMTELYVMQIVRAHV